MIKSLKVKEAKDISKLEAYTIIRTYLEAEINLARRTMQADESFASPAWSEQQAYLLGKLKALDKVLQFIPDIKD